ncbi:MAG: hypothetical protein CMJ29_05500 [Phycisphaerae bacterium]|nr:hypothetical protein [Phycisphaerae bacterium]
MLTTLLLTILSLLGPGDDFKLPGLGLPQIPVPGAAAEEIFNDSRDRVSVEVLTDRTRAVPGEQLVLAVIFDHDPGWHIHTNDPVVPPELGEPSDYIKTELIFEPLDGPIQVHPQFTQWPEVHDIQVSFTGSPVSYGVFEGKAIAYVPLTISKEAPLGPASLTVKPVFQVCDDTSCLMPTPGPGGYGWDDYSGLTVTVEIVSEDAIKADPDPPAHPDIFEDFDADAVGPLNPPSGSRSSDGSRSSSSINTTEATPEETAEFEDETASFFGLKVPKTGGFLGGLILILLGILGGFILNLTPCVLPVIPIKIMTLSQHAGTPGRAFSLGLWMALGVFAFWLVIGLPAVLFASFADPSMIFGIWWVTFGIGLLIGIMGIGIMGLFTLSLPQSTYMINPKADNAWGSFLFGVMTAVLGLPCFGFIAGALFASAATLPPFVTILIFGSIGIGMGAPYLLLAAYPKLVERIPRTGPASDLVKQVMGLLLLAAAAYFIGSGLIGLVAEQPWMAKLLHWWAIAIALILAGGWLCLRTFQITSHAGHRIIWTLVALILAAIPTIYAIGATEKARNTWQVLEEARLKSAGAYLTTVWNPYDPITFEAAREDGKIIVVDFTAEWCINCKALKATVLDQDPVKQRLAEDDRIVMFTADNTSRTAYGWELMREIGQTGIPLLAIWSPDDPFTEPWQSTAYTSQQVMEALDEAEGELDAP